jgi:drug/metabolite transporter (DMT)-like permease
MVVFIYISPFVVALGMPFIAHSERLSRAQMIGLLIAFAGVAWAFEEGFNAPAAGPKQLFGDALGVLAGVLWGATTLAIRGTKLSGASAEKTLLYQLAISGGMLALAALTTGVRVPNALSALAWGSMGFQIVIVTAFSYLLWFWLVGRYAATRLASFTLLTPVFGLVMGALLLGEAITLRLVIALIAVAAGIVLVNRRT